MSIRPFALLAVAVLVQSCASYKPAQEPAKLSEAPLAGTELPSGGQWPTASWWERYQDPTLNQLVTTALTDSPTLAAAHARFDSARESVRVAAAASGAHVDASASATRQRLSDYGLIPPQFLGFSWYNQTDLDLSASYTFDWWGKQRASVESATDEAKAAAADRVAAALVLSGSVVDTYFGWQADQARIALLQERINTLSRLSAIAAARERAELTDADEQHQVDSDLAAARSQLAGLKASAQLRLVALAALTGHAVAQLPALTAKALPVLPPALPEGLSLDLLSRRPDITASRWRVEAARQRRHVAEAQYYPDISVKGLIGLESLDLAKLLEAGSRVPQIGLAVHLPLFDNGLRSAQLGEADTEIAAAVATYNDAIITAARELTGSVIADDQAAAQRKEQLAQLEASSALQEHAEARMRQGLTDARLSLNAQFAVLLQRDALVQIDAAGLTADSALQRALGGGFENSSTRTGSTYSP